MKGQTALEYLITYGWAILVILVVLAVLWYYGIFNPARWAGESVTEGSAFKIVDKNLQVGTLKLSLGNKAGTTVTINSINVSGDVYNTALFVTGLPETVVAGANIVGTYEIPVEGLSAGSVGSFARFTVTVNYDVVGGIADKTDVAQFSIKVSG
jgi:TRAP-type C4-dicarboxylate transport system permease large subunit